MKVKTKFLDEIEVDEKDILRFEKRLPGFPEEDRFVMVPIQEGSPFYLLQSVKTTPVAFVVLNPYLFYTDYEFKLPGSVQKELQINESSRIEVWTMVVLKDELKKSTVNLKAPIIINRDVGKGQQIILEKEQYETRHLLFAGNQEESPVAEGES
ncbi:MAG: flagellar assembly protein FliW [Bacillaceae bacterium]|nr:flagellar assembly protein FliW [Bacillaceae bacterium]